MEEVSLFENIQYIKHISLFDVAKFLVLFSILLAIQGLITFILRVRKPKTNFQKRIAPAIISITNWAAFYGAILLFLFSFSKEKWLFSPFYSSGEVEVSLFLIIMVLLVITFANRLVKAFNKYIMPSLYDRFDIEIGVRYTINRIIYYTVMFLALAVSFTTVGLNLSALTVIFSVLGIGIGFGMRNVAANFVSGVIILLERPIEIGETVQIEGELGKITQIRLRSTMVQTLESGTFIVPNQYFIEQIIKNRTSAAIFSEVKVRVTYGTDTKKVTSLLQEAIHTAIKETEGLEDNTVSDVRFISFDYNGLVFIAEVTVPDIETKELLENNLRHAIAKIFYQHDITLAPLPFDIKQ